MKKLLLATMLVVLGCSPRGELAFVPVAPGPTSEIFTGSTRGPDPTTGALFASTRSEKLDLARFEVSVPPERTTGSLSYPLTGRRVDPAKDFALVDQELYSTPAPFRSDLHRAIAAHNGDAIVFIHGFNTNFAEGLYRLAQMGEDFELPGALVYYAWPSRGHVLGYAYDRDSALFSRDGLQELLAQLRGAGAKRILLVAHSMGSALTMETLRQMRLSGETETLSRISGVVLISPDIDVDVFREQARRVGTLPQPFVIFTSQRDKALLLSSRIAGERNRLGNLKDVSRVADLKVTLIDTGAFNTADGHFNVANNPSLIKLLSNTGQLAKILEGEQAGRSNLATGVVMTVENATQIILSPISALGGAN